MKPRRDGGEAALFREAVKDVKPLARGGPAPRPPPLARSGRAGRRTDPEESLEGGPDGAAPGAGEELAFRRPGVQESVLRKLRRGRFRVQGEIDLHGLRAVDARRALRAFLADAVAESLRCVRIVHGKGLRSGSRGPILKGEVDAILRGNSAVLAFVSARPDDGGTGAAYVLLATAPARGAIGSGRGSPR